MATVAELKQLAEDGPGAHVTIPGPWLAALCDVAESAARVDYWATQGREIQGLDGLSTALWALDEAVRDA